MAEYMTVEDNIITGIFCGKVEKGENIIILPTNHQVRCGETLEFYNKDWTRKSKVELIRLGLEECPQGYIVDGDNVRLMDFEERIIAGLDSLPSYQKVVEGKLVNKTEEELWAEKTPEEKATAVRQKRNILLNEVDTLLLKYSEQVELGVVQTNESYRLELLQYKQALRDITEQVTFPESVEYPELPVLQQASKATKSKTVKSETVERL